MPKRTLNKSDIIEEIATVFDIPKSRAEKIVNALFTEMIQNLKEGKRIEFRGFGSFAAKEYEGYVGRNPDTGEETIVPAKRRLRFRMSDVLFSELNKDLDG
jgi:integration host factor subunit beta